MNEGDDKQYWNDSKRDIFISDFKAEYKPEFYPEWGEMAYKIKRGHINDIKDEITYN